MKDLCSFIEETILNEAEKERALEGLENNYIALKDSNTYDAMKETLELNGYKIKDTKYLDGEFIIFLC